MPSAIYKSTIKQVTARAPATLANMAVGFDLIGVAILKPADEVVLTARDDHRLVISQIHSQDDLPYQVTKNTATIALRSAIKKHGPGQGFNVVITKGIDCASGMGGSAASSVAALTAYNHFLKKPLSLPQLLQHAIRAEMAVSGAACIENVAASLWGGLVLCPDAATVRSLPTPAGMLLAVKPAVAVETKAARGLLPEQVSMADCTRRAGRCAAWVDALHLNQTELAASLMVDDIVEPARAILWPHYKPIKQAAIKAGALAVCMSGSGPTVMVWLRRKNLSDIKKVIQTICDRRKQPCQLWSSSWQAPGASVVGVRR